MENLTWPSSNPSNQPISAGSAANQEPLAKMVGSLEEVAADLSAALSRIGSNLNGPRPEGVPPGVDRVQSIGVRQSLGRAREVMRAALVRANEIEASIDG